MFMLMEYVTNYKGDMQLFLQLEKEVKKFNTAFEESDFYKFISSKRTMFDLIREVRIADPDCGLSLLAAYVAKKISEFNIYGNGQGGNEDGKLY